MRRLLITLLVTIFLPISSYSADYPQILYKYLTQPIEVGNARLSVFIFDVYDAYLYAPSGEFDFNKNFALRLHYLRKLEGKDIAKKSIDLIKRQGFKDKVTLATWYSQMEKIFPDVDKGVEIIGIRRANGESIFLKDNKEIGKINDPLFTAYFFSIWLGEDSKYPKIRHQLIYGDI